MVERSGVASAGLGEIVTPAAAGAGERTDSGEKGTGRETVRSLRGHGRQKTQTAVDDAGQEDHRGAPEACTQPIRRLAERGGRHAVQGGGEHAHAAHLDTAGEKIRAASIEKSPFEFGDAPLLPPQLRLKLFKPLGEIRHRNVETVGGVEQKRLTFVRPTKRREARHRLEPTNTGCERTFARDLEAADLAGAGNVGPAAKLERNVPETHHAHLIAVFFTEKGQSPSLLRFGQGDKSNLRGKIGEDGAHDVLFHPRAFLATEWARGGKIESQTIGRHKRPALLDLFAEHPA